MWNISTGWLLFDRHGGFSCYPRELLDQCCHFVIKLCKNCSAVRLLIKSWLWTSLTLHNVFWHFENLLSLSETFTKYNIWIICIFLTYVSHIRTHKKFYLLFSLACGICWWNIAKKAKKSTLFPKTRRSDDLEPSLEGIVHFSIFKAAVVARKIDFFRHTFPISCNCFIKENHLQF